MAGLSTYSVLLLAIIEVEPGGPLGRQNASFVSRFFGSDLGGCELGCGERSCSGPTRSSETFEVTF